MFGCLVKIETVTSTGYNIVYLSLSESKNIKFIVKNTIADNGAS